MSDVTRRQNAAPRPLSSKTSECGRRCVRCGASILKIAENPFTKALQCKVCGARQI